MKTITIEIPDDLTHPAGASDMEIAGGCLSEVARSPPP
jgi:hypothetical protein